MNILLIPRINVQNANALSSPYTIGFPAMTAWLGAVHALQRNLRDEGFNDLVMKKTGVICHEFNLRAYKGKGDFVHSIIGTGNPLDKDGNRSAFIEEARCNLTVSLVIQLEGIKIDQEQQFISGLIIQLASAIKLAAGDIFLGQEKPEIRNIENEDDMKKLTRKLMPGYALVERRDLMIKAMDNNDAMNAMLDYLKAMHRSKLTKDNKVKWTSKRKEKGWIVPIATGFHGITELAQAINQRDPNVPHRFAESVVTLGEFIMPCRIKYLHQLLWSSHVDIENSLYLCQQEN